MYWEDTSYTALSLWNEEIYLSGASGTKQTGGFQRVKRNMSHRPVHLTISLNVRKTKEKQPTELGAEANKFRRVDPPLRKHYIRTHFVLWSCKREPSKTTFVYKERHNITTDTPSGGPLLPEQTRIGSISGPPGSSLPGMGRCGIPPLEIYLRRMKADKTSNWSRRGGTKT